MKTSFSSYLISFIFLVIFSLLIVWFSLLLYELLVLWLFFFFLSRRQYLGSISKNEFLFTKIILLDKNIPAENLSGNFNFWAVQIAWI